MDQLVRIPKNIRQMGVPGDKQKVYIEDYVYTYLHIFLKEKHPEEPLKTAVVFGEYYLQDGVTYTFIKGAVDLTLDGNPKELEDYFPDLKLVGWYVSSPGVDAHVQSQIQHRYAENNPQLPHYLIYEDELEREIQVFAWEQHALHGLTGYYIYYEKNPNMQDFLIREKGGLPQENPIRIERQPVKPFPDNNERNARALKRAQDKARIRKPQRLLYAACGVVLVLLVAMGVSQIGDYQNLHNLQTAISGAFVTGRDKDSTGEEQESVESDQETTDSSQELNEDGQDGTEVGQEVIDDEQDGTEVGQDVSGEATENTGAEAGIESGTDNSVSTTPASSEQSTSGTSDTSASETSTSTPDTYTVKRGDTLYTISQAIYGDVSKVQEICELNDISNVHLIYEGQILKLP